MSKNDETIEAYLFESPFNLPKPSELLRKGEEERGKAIEKTQEYLKSLRSIYCSSAFPYSLLRFLLYKEHLIEIDNIHEDLTRYLVAIVNGTNV